MASSAKHLIFFLLMTTLTSSLLHISHARDSQFFSKTPSTTTTNDVVPNTIESKEPEKMNQEQAEPSFLPQNEESYGLYGHEAGQLPPSSTTTGGRESKQPLHKYLPKNYNPVAYVTVPENTNGEVKSEFGEETTFDTTNPYASSYNNDDGEENYYNGQQKEEDFSEYRRSYPTATSNTQMEGLTYSNNNKYDRLGSDFNSPRETTSFAAAAEGFQRQQGMSDTRFLENGKYHYDVKSERFSRNHPYEALKGDRVKENEFRGESYEPEGEYHDMP